MVPVTSTVPVRVDPERFALPIERLPPAVPSEAVVLMVVDDRSTTASVPERVISALPLTVTFPEALSSSRLKLVAEIVVLSKSVKFAEFESVISPAASVPEAISVSLSKALP